MNELPLHKMDYRYRSTNTTKPNSSSEGIIERHYHHTQGIYSGTTGLPANYPPNSSSTSQALMNTSSAETAVSEALLTLSSAAGFTNDMDAKDSRATAPAVPNNAFQSPPPPPPRPQVSASSSFSVTPPQSSHSPSLPPAPQYQRRHQYQHQHQQVQQQRRPSLPSKKRRPSLVASAPTIRRVSLVGSSPPPGATNGAAPTSAVVGYHHHHQQHHQPQPHPKQPRVSWTTQSFVPQVVVGGTYETPKRSPSPSPPAATQSYCLPTSRPLVVTNHEATVASADAAAVAPPATKKARTVSPLPAVANALDCSVPAAPATSTTPTTTTGLVVNNDDMMTQFSSVSCICPVCSIPIKGLGDHKVDWSQPVQGRQRAKTITSIKKHVKDHHKNEPIWNVIVNSLDVTPSSRSSSSSSNSSSDGTAPTTTRVVTAQAFVTQALKKAALDQIPNHPRHLRSFRWTEKIMDQRVGIAKGFIQFGGQEYLRNKECHDETGNKINPKSLRNLAYSLLQSMYDDLMSSLVQNQHPLQAAMATAPLGLLRNRFQLLFAAPDKWSESWYMDPTKYDSVSSSNSRC